MGFGNILGQLMQDGLGGQAQPRDRVTQSAQNLGNAGGGLNEIFRQLQGAATGGQASAGVGGAGFGGLADMAKDFLGKDQIGGLSGGQIGGIGAAAGALLGGGLGGAARGGAMAILGTLALSALRGVQAKAAGTASGAGTGTPIGTEQVKELTVQPKEISDLTAPDAQRMVVRAMISAAKADGQLDQEEMKKIIGKISADDITDDEKQFVMAEMRAPLDIDALAAEATSPAQAAEIYAASILAISIDSDQEKQYLQQLAQTLRLDPQVVARLHELTGAPAV